MKKKILTFMLGSSFIFADCSEPIKNANSGDQSACVKATECLKDETTQLVNILEKLENTSKQLNRELLQHADGVARCENWKAYAKKELSVRRWQVLAEDCQKHYINLGNTLSRAKKNLQVISNTTRLKRQVEASEASLDYIKDKCNSSLK